MKKITAITKTGLRIITVLAKDNEDARKKITDQLSHPGRMSILKVWENLGQPVKIFKIDDLVDSELGYGFEFGIRLKNKSGAIDAHRDPAPETSPFEERADLNTLLSAAYTFNSEELEESEIDDLVDLELGHGSKNK